MKETLEKLVVKENEKATDWVRAKERVDRVIPLLELGRYRNPRSR